MFPRDEEHLLSCLTRGITLVASPDRKLRVHPLVPPLDTRLRTFKVAKLAELVTEWAVSSRCVLGREHSFNGVTRYHQLRKSPQDTDASEDFESGPGV